MSCFREAMQVLVAAVQLDAAFVLLERVRGDRGFSDDPGCRESHSAYLTLDAWRDGVPRLHQRVPLAVLEFGGTFQC